MNKYLVLLILSSILLLTSCTPWSGNNQNDVLLQQIEANERLTTQVLEQAQANINQGGNDKWFFLLLTLAVMGFAMWSMSLNRTALSAPQSTPQQNNAVEIPLALLPDEAQSWLIENGIDMSTHKMMFDFQSGHYKLVDSHGNVLGISEHNHRQIGVNS